GRQALAGAVAVGQAGEQAAAVVGGGHVGQAPVARQRAAGAVGRGGDARLDRLQALRALGLGAGDEALPPGLPGLVDEVDGVVGHQRRAGPAVAGVADPVEVVFAGGGGLHVVVARVVAAPVFDLRKGPRVDDRAPFGLDARVFGRAEAADQQRAV